MKYSTIKIKKDTMCFSIFKTFRNAKVQSEGLVFATSDTNERKDGRQKKRREKMRT